jgi:hypothetical protein
MRSIICAAACIALCAGSTAVQAKKPAPAAAFEINKTTWTFTDKKGVKVRESIDASGNYIANSVAGKHIDHGTSVMKDGKACFTSAMDKQGEVCWTTPKYALKIGHSFVTKSDKGETLKVRRVAYTPLSIPK